MNTLLEREANLASYDPSEVMKIKFYENCYLFDLAREGQIIAARAPHIRMRLGESFFSLLSEEDRSFFESYWREYPQAPLVTDTRMGIAVILPSLMADTALGIALIPRVQRADLLSRLDEEIQRPFVWTESLRASLSHGENAPTETAIAPTRWELPHCFDPLSLSAESMERELTERLHELSRFCGCPIHPERIGDVPHHEGFNPSLFTAFSLVTLLLCRAESSARECWVTLEQVEGIPSVSFRIANPSREILSAPAMEWLHQLADRKRLILESTLLTGALHLRLVPMDADWAYLGLKQSKKDPLFGKIKKKS